MTRSDLIITSSVLNYQGRIAPYLLLAIIHRKHDIVSKTKFRFAHPTNEAAIRYNEVLTLLNGGYISYILDIDRDQFHILSIAVFRNLSNA